ncbi:hypothetical protein [Pyrococcus kukulkanii]|uniref:hypothetical protein n=1 Tax=Pyrococcus kukulkanii TaxID=1609559 RepID=UPI003562E9CF
MDKFDPYIRLADLYGLEYRKVLDMAHKINSTIGENLNKYMHMPTHVIKKKTLDEVVRKYSGRELWVARGIVLDFFIEGYAGFSDINLLTLHPDDLVIYTFIEGYHLGMRDNEIIVDEEEFERHYGMTKNEFKELLKKVIALSKQVDNLLKEVRDLDEKTKLVAFSYYIAVISVLKNSMAFRHISRLFDVDRGDIYSLLSILAFKLKILDPREILREYRDSDTLYHVALSLMPFFFADKFEGKDYLDRAVKIIESLTGEVPQKVLEEVKEYRAGERSEEELSPLAKAITGAVAVVRYLDSLEAYTKWKATWISYEF